MERESFLAALDVVYNFLVSRGWNSSSMTEDIRDGHWIVDWLEKYKNQELCPCGYEPALKELEKMMREGRYIDGSPMEDRDAHPWTDECSRVFFAAAGLED